MVPAEGANSNSISVLQESWSQAKSAESLFGNDDDDPLIFLELMEVFEHWSTYLENHAPYFQEARYEL